MNKKLNVALIGCGFMGRTHSNAYRKVNNFFDLPYEPVMKVVSSRQQEKLKVFAANWGWEDADTDWRSVVKRDDIDMVDICVPNNLHYDIALAAAAAGKIIACEKPLAMSSAEAKKMATAVEEKNRPNMVWFNYRRVPAVALAKQLIDDGCIGKVFHYRAKYLQDWTISSDVPQGGNTFWRLDKNSAGSGVTGDLLAHSFDLAEWFVGKIDKVCAMTETFIKERDLQDDIKKSEPVEIDDACAVLTRFKNGALGTFESTRYARGRKNQKTFEINGEKGSIYFDLEDAHELQFFSHDEKAHLRGWRTIKVWEPEHPYMSNWWVPGCSIGYEHTFIHTLADFLKGIGENKKLCPDFRDGIRTQLVCDAVLDSAANERWKTVE